MKRMSLFLLIAIAMFLSFNLYAQSRPVAQQVINYGTVWTDPLGIINPEPGSIYWEAYITARPAEVQVLGDPFTYADVDATGKFTLRFNIGNVFTQWNPGETLRFEIIQTTTGFIKNVDIVIPAGSATIARYDELAVALEMPPAVLFDSRPDVLNTIYTTANLMPGYPIDGVYRANYWVLNDNWNISFSTLGVIGNLQVTSKLRRAYFEEEEEIFDLITGPRNFRTFYSIDGGASWVQNPVLGYATPNSEDWITIEYELPSVCYNLPDVKLRWVLFATGGSTVVAYPEQSWGEIKDVIVTAEKPLGTITVYKVGEGTVLFDGVEITEFPFVEQYEEETEVSLEASPSQGWLFEKWIINGDTILEPVIDVTIPSDDYVLVEVYFVQGPTLNIDILGQGDIELDGLLITLPYQEYYFENEEVMLEAIETLEYWYFYKWVVNGVEETENPINLTLTENVNVVAYFAYMPPPPEPALFLYPADEGSDVPIEFTFQWEPSLEGITPDGYLFNYWIAEEVQPEMLDLLDETSFIIVEELLYYTEYNWQVVPYINLNEGILEAEDCPIWSFNTMMAPPQILVLPSLLSFGNVAIEHTVSLPMMIYNHGDEDLEIYGITPSNPRFTVSLPEGLDYTFTIAGKDSLEILINFTPLVVQSYSANLVFVSNDPDNDVLVKQLNGNGYVLNADFVAEPLTGEIPLTVQFIDISQGDIVSYYWEFGDGYTSEEINPEHTYYIKGDYDVTITVQDQYITKTLTRDNYINAVAHPIIASPDSTGIAYGVVYLEDIETRELLLQSVGTDSVYVYQILFYHANTPFSVDPLNVPAFILPGEEAEIEVFFQPMQAVSFVDTLYVHNSSENHPILKIRLTGVGEYVPPKSPENVAISIIDVDAVITWSPVTHNIYDTPIDVPYYFVYGSIVPDPDNTQLIYLGYSTGTSFTHYGIGLPGSNVQPPRIYFYQVTAVVWYPPVRGDEAWLNDLVGKTRKEVAEIMASWIK